MKKTLIILALIIGWIFINPVLAHELDEPIIPVDIGQSAPNFQLLDQDGQPFNLESLQGKVILLTFLYTQCPDVCPLLITYMQQTQDLLEDNFGREVVFITISFDPNDTPEVLRTYAAKHRADLSGWKFLTSQNEDDMKHVTEAYGIFFQREEEGGYSHSLFTYLIDKDLIVTKLYFGTFLNSNDVAKDISDLISPPFNLTPYLPLSLIGGIFIFGAFLYLHKKRKSD
jgi:protein SCO1/2